MRNGVYEFEEEFRKVMQPVNEDVRDERLQQRRYRVQGGGMRVCLCTPKNIKVQILRPRAQEHTQCEGPCYKTARSGMSAIKMHEETQE